ncbi:MAG: CapA family protein [Marinilabiliaceae bacterium]|nr:CapA family protein [Marinilabiliaceae bacterium]
MSLLLLRQYVYSQCETPDDAKRVLITFVGDCTLGTYKGQTAGADGRLFSNYFEEKGASYFFESVKELFVSDDITFVNLEGPLTTVPQVAVKQFPIKGNPEYVNILKSSGVEVCNLANNHIFDCGQDGFSDCVKNLDKSGLLFCGEGYSCDTIINDIHVGFLGYRIFSVTEQLKRTIKKDISELRGRGCHVICVMMHGGVEGKHDSNAQQSSIAHFIADNGADIVIGHHPHVIQGIERYKGKTICYSLGNFCFGANKNPKDKDTFVFQQEFVLKDSICSYGNSKIVPCRISSSDTTNDYRPTIQSGERGQVIIDKLRSYSQQYAESYFE